MRTPLRPILAATLVATLGAGPLVAQRPPESTRSPASSPASTRTSGSDEIPDSYRKVLQVLRARKAQNHAEEVTFRFASLEGPTWPRIRLKEIRATQGGPVVVLEDDAREYRPGDPVLGARLVTVAGEEALFEFNGETRRFSLKRAFPAISVRVIKQVEGELAVFLEDEKRARYAGDAFRDAKILRIEPDGVTVQVGAEVRKLVPREVKPVFPEVSFTGVIEMGGGRVALIRGKPDPARVGDTIEGARVVEITPTYVTLEFQGETRAIPIH